MVFTIWSAYLVAKKMCWGWVVGILASIFWIIYATVTRQPALVIMNFVILIIDMYGLKKWTNRDIS